MRRSLELINAGAKLPRLTLQCPLQVNASKFKVRNRVHCFKPNASLLVKAWLITQRVKRKEDKRSLEVVTSQWSINVVTASVSTKLKCSNRTDFKRDGQRDRAVVIV